MCIPWQIKIMTVISLIVLIIAGCSGASSPNHEPSNSASTAHSATDTDYFSQNYSFSSGGPSGTMYPTAVSITQILRDHTKWDADMNIFPGGGIANVINTNTGKAEFGLSYSSAIVTASVGEEPFGEPHQDIASAAALFPYYAQWVTLAESDIDSIEDLKGKKVNLGTKGQASRLVAEAIFEVYGMDESELAKAESLGFDDSVQQLKDGQLDAIFQQADAPFGAYQELSQTVGMKLIPIDEGKLQALQAMNPGMIPGVIKAGTYQGIDVDTPTVKTPLSLIVSKNLPEQLVYDMVKGFREQFESFQTSLPPLNQLEGPEEFAIDIGIDFHSGAEKYYEEQGWLD